MAGSTQIFPKHGLSRNVWDLAITRFEYLYKTYDTVYVSFSGGKDSTVCLQLACKVAKAMGKLPVKTVFYDEEAIQPDTITYVDECRKNLPIDLKWYCIPVRHRNACSSTHPWWYPWAPEDKDKWVRPFPKFGLTEEQLPGFRRLPISDLNNLPYGPEYGTVAVVMGVRTQESMTRYNAIAGNKIGFGCFISTNKCLKHVVKAYPIYDWTDEDVWLAPSLHKWNYNKAYDLMAKAGITLHGQRIAPPYGEQPIRALWMFKVLWPELWAKMSRRVPGAATAARYANTELYGVGNLDEIKPADATWRDFIMNRLQAAGTKARPVLANAIRLCLNDHKRYTKEPMPDSIPHAQSGYCWQEISRIVLVQDLKDGRILFKVKNRARTMRIAAGVKQA